MKLPPLPPDDIPPLPEIKKTNKNKRFIWDCYSFHMNVGSKRHFLPWFALRSWRKRLLIITAAALTGTIAILFAIGAEPAIGLHRALTFGSGKWWFTLVLAPGGFALLAWISQRFFAGTEGSGIPQAIAASLAEDRPVRKQFLSFRLAIAKVFLTLGGLLVGASTGREGPTVQVGASIMHTLSNRKRFGQVATSRDLICAGAGAGIAAAFNTPLGGIMFAIEEMCRYRGFRGNSTTMIAVVFAGLMSLSILGNKIYFGRTFSMLSWPAGIWPIVIAGILGGLFGGYFAQILINSSRGLPGQIGVFSRQRPVLFAAFCGLGTAIVGIATNGLTYGTGYDETRHALQGASSLPLTFMFAKMAVIWLAFAARIPGGMFAPALAVGAGMGAIIDAILPEMGISHSAILVLGMVAFLAAMTQSPMTAFVIVMEMTDNHRMLLPLIATSVIAYGISRSVCRMPLYHALAMPSLYRAETKYRASLEKTQT